MERTIIKDLAAKIGQEVCIKGSIAVRRDHGKLIFLDVRDRSGVVQSVVLPNHKEALEEAGKLRGEWVVEIKGIVNKRPEKMVKEGVLNGDIEIEITDVIVVAKAHELPFELDAEINIDTYLDQFSKYSPKFYERTELF